MVRNKRELLSAAAEWVSQAKHDLATQLNNFMRVMNTTPAQMADALGVTEATLNGVMRGTTVPDLDFFAKVLIATNHMLEIKPLGRTPFGSMGSAPARGTRHPFDGAAPIPPTEAPQPRDARGRFARRAATPTAPAPTAPAPEAPSGFPMPEDVRPFGDAPMGEPQVAVIDFDEMSKTEIKNFILEQGWATEDELAGATREELIDLAEEHAAEAENMERVEGEAPAGEADFEDDGGDWDVEEDIDDEADEDGELARILAQTLRDNPALKSTIKRFLN